MKYLELYSNITLYEYISIQRFENQMYLPFSRLTISYSLEKIERVV